jgi:hypothetical protein
MNPPLRSWRCCSTPPFHALVHGSSLCQNTSSLQATWWIPISPSNPNSCIISWENFSIKALSSHSLFQKVNCSLYLAPCLLPSTFFYDSNNTLYNNSMFTHLAFRTDGETLGPELIFLKFILLHSACCLALNSHLIHIFDKLIGKEFYIHNSIWFSFL